MLINRILHFQLFFLQFYSSTYARIIRFIHYTWIISVLLNRMFTKPWRKHRLLRWLWRGEALPKFFRRSQRRTRGTAAACPTQTTRKRKWFARLPEQHQQQKIFKTIEKLIDLKNLLFAKMLMILWTPKELVRYQTEDGSNEKTRKSVCLSLNIIVLFRKSSKW